MKNILNSKQLIFSAHHLVYNEMKYNEAIETLTQYNFTRVIEEIKEDADYLEKGAV